MYRTKNHAVTREHLFGMIVFALFVLLSDSVTHAQSSGQCTANVFVEGTIAGSGGTAVGLAITAQNNLYIANNVGAGGPIPGPVAFKVTPQGTISIVVPEGIPGDVTALAIDSQGNLYVADGNVSGPTASNQPLRKT